MLRLALIAAAAAAVLVIGAVTAARAEPLVCGAPTDIARALFEKYGEVPIWRGADREGAMVVLFARPDGKTWTAVKSLEAKLCLVDAGSASQLAQRQAKEER